MFDLVYCFHFNNEDFDFACQRLKCSIDSIKEQDVNICIFNSSKKDIEPFIKTFLSKFSYIHKVEGEPFSRAKSLNFAINNLVSSEYFIISDIDLVFKKDYVKQLTNILQQHKDEKIRVIGYNLNINDYVLSSNFDELIKLYFSEIGFAHGCGLVNLESFKNIGGYDEFFVGYGPEDDEFNSRLKQINKLIYVNNGELETCHLKHRQFNYFLRAKNEMYYNKKKLEFKNLKQKEVQYLIRK